MTELLETFRRSVAESNLRGELDGAAWRFVLPGDVDRVLWRKAPGSGAARDREVIARHAAVVIADGCVPADGEPIGLVVGRMGVDDEGRVGIDVDDGDDASTGRTLELHYEDDELRGVAPLADTSARAILAREVGPPGPVPRSLKQRIRRRPQRIRRTTRGSLRGVQDGPPAWLVEAASAAGTDISRHGWALWCRGEFGSQKLVMFLVPPGGTEASAVVKITRDPRFNDRLVNESEVLHAIGRFSPAVTTGAPTPLFDATVWGSAAVAQAAVVGTDLRAQLGRRPELVGRVTEWMTALALESNSPVLPGEVAECLGELIDRYCAIYPVPSAVEAFLRSQAGELSRAEFGAVVQHGDPGPWNAVTTPDGGFAFLDWEAGEVRGFPLWDLLYFLRSASLVTSVNRPWQTRRSRVRRDLVDGSPVGDAIATHVHAYVDAVRLDPALVEPLFHLCWVHRAVKQANRLPVRRRASGTFHQLVLDGVQRRDHVGLRRIVTPSGTTTTGTTTIPMGQQDA